MAATLDELKAKLAAVEAEMDNLVVSPFTGGADIQSDNKARWEVLLGQAQYLTRKINGFAPKAMSIKGLDVNA